MLTFYYVNDGGDKGAVEGTLLLGEHSSLVHLALDTLLELQAAARASLQVTEVSKDR